MKPVQNKSDSKKRKRDDSQDTIAESPKKAKVHAQRKFAQGASYNSPSIAVIKDKIRPPANVSPPGLMLSTKRPNTEDFLTFLCFRRTSILPPKLDFFKDAYKQQPALINCIQKSKNSNILNKNPAVEGSMKQNHKKYDKSDALKRTQTPVQALRKKYQEQRLAKQNPTNVTKLAQKVKGKNMMRTRSSTLHEEKSKPVEKISSAKEKKVQVSGLRSGFQRTAIEFTKLHKKNEVSNSVKNLRSRVKEQNQNKAELKPFSETKPSKISLREVALKKVDTTKNAKSAESNAVKNKDRRVNRKKFEGLSDFSSDDNEPLLAVKNVKCVVKSEKLANGLKEGLRVNSAKTRSQVNGTNSSQPSSTPIRPTRKTKEAAAIYMEMITKKLVSPEKSGDDDRSSVDSFPELPNAKRNEQRESELRAKVVREKKNNKITSNKQGLNSDAKDRRVRPALHMERIQKSLDHECNSRKKDYGKKFWQVVNGEVPKRSIRENQTKKTTKEQVIKRPVRDGAKKVMDEAVSKKIGKEDPIKKALREESCKNVVKEEYFKKLAREEHSRKSVKEDISKKLVKDEPPKKICAYEQVKKSGKEDTSKKGLREDLQKRTAVEVLPKKVGREDVFKKSLKEESTKKATEEVPKKVVKVDSSKKAVKEESKKVAELPKKVVKEDTSKKVAPEESTKKLTEEVPKKVVKEDASKKVAQEESTKKLTEEVPKKVVKEDASKKVQEESTKKVIEVPKKVGKDDASNKAVKEEPAKTIVPKEISKTIVKDEVSGKMEETSVPVSLNTESMKKRIEEPLQKTVEEHSKEVIREESSKKMTDETRTKPAGEESAKPLKEEYLHKMTNHAIVPGDDCKRGSSVKKMDENESSQGNNLRVKSAEDIEVRPLTRKKQEESEARHRKATERTTGMKKPTSHVKKGSTSGASTPCNSWLPSSGAAGSRLVEAPTFYPTEKEFQDPLEFFERIRPAAESFGLCRIVPPSTFKPDCKVSDDMRFTAYNQYVHRMFHRWGPNIKEMMAIKKYLATQSISLKQPPWIGGIEVDLPRLYQSVQNCGGLMKVMEKKKWNQVADMMRIPKAAQDRVTKLDDIYCKYLLPYDTLSHDERQKLFEEVEKDWARRQESTNDSDEDSEEEIYIDECEECIVKGRNMALNQFYRIARNTMSMWFKTQEPGATEVENEFWRHVSERNNHVCVHSGSIDSSGWGYGFPVSKNNSFSRHPWNLKVLTNNSGSVLRSLGPVMGVTVPTLHVGMVFTAFCWYRDPHGLPWVEYLHTGAPKIWYGISDDNSSVFKEALTKLLPRYIKNKKIWLPCDTAMVPPALLVEQGVSLCHTIQKPGQFILVFPRAFTSSICTGYLVSESVYFAQPSWLTTAEQVFHDIQDCCEPTMFSLEKLLFSIATDSRSSVDVLKQVLPMVWHIKQNEIDSRKTLFNLGLKVSERLPLRDQGASKKKKGKWVQDEEGDYECDVCRANLSVSLVINSQEEGVLCLSHAIECLTQKRHHLKYCKLMYSYTQEELCELVEKLEQRIESKSQRKVSEKSTTLK